MKEFYAGLILTCAMVVGTFTFAISHSFGGERTPPTPYVIDFPVPVISISATNILHWRGAPPFVITVNQGSKTNLPVHLTQNRIFAGALFFDLPTGLYTLTVTGTNSSRQIVVKWLAEEPVGEIKVE